MALQDRLATTTLYVTHDQVEAMTMGDRIAVMSHGVLQQVAAPEDLYARPANTFVAGFLGSPGMNLLPGHAWPRGDDGDLTVGGVGAGRSHSPGPPTAAGPSIGRGGPRPPPRIAAHRPPRATVAPTVTIVELLGAETHVICRTPDGSQLIVRQSGAGGQARTERAGPHRRRSATRRPSISSTPPRPSARGTMTHRPAGVAVADRSTGAKGTDLRTRRRREAGLAYLLLLPALVVFGAFTFYPFFRNFKLMLYETPPVPGLPAHYVGLHQITPVLTLHPVHPEPA